MNKFHFSLEKVLNIREFEEEEAKIELGKAVSVVNQINSQLEFIAQERVKNNLARKEETDFTLLFTIENYIKGLDARKEKLLNELAQAELVVEEKRILYTQAMQKRKALDKLKEKQMAEYKRLSELEEEKILDDLKIKKNEIGQD
ncbi:MAG: flagellar export protein FliJ [Treponemataceae bacterium]|nr:flagellar export protein FliJ [Treponemataceae bacterium]